METHHSQEAENTDDEWEIVSSDDDVNRSQDLPHQTQRVSYRLPFRVSLEISISTGPPPDCPKRDLGLPRSIANEHKFEQHQCLLFSLPVEIRMVIYELVMYQPTGEVDIRRFPHDITQPSALALLVTCRRVLHEAEPVFYSVNRLWLDMEHVQFLNSVGARRRSAIKKVAITASSGSAALLMLSQLRALPKLQSLYIRRTSSIRFIHISSWRVMVKQLQTELRAHHQLSELKLLTPEVRGLLSEDESVRKRQMDEVDSELKKAAVRSVSD
ncbi:hypothetical protein K431DRAFT_98201 [Polychaeton citri CBS 116435]|uniref:Uncharacterized protein n=1 Tax=Polychaeton citri CBS 116435 TaxID=1314669 RepID=A0A9P4UTX4_9PEZI|nr:hypothetical protein K431DRAFT_98201 [Polychaeton citri CBS 116435]